MRHTDKPTPADPPDELDLKVRDAFTAWDSCHADISRLRREYDVALSLFERRDGPEPSSLRLRLKTMQEDCDVLFFQLLRSAEVRTRERYI